MKKVLIFTILLLIGGKSFAQETGNDSYTIQRLIIFNENGEQLFQKHKNGWMTPAQWFPQKIAIQKMLDPEAKIVTAVGEMTKHILNYTNIIWSGSYLLVKEEG